MFQMVGNPAFPPYWALGFHLSRYGYNSTEGVRAARLRMKAMNIPQVTKDCLCYSVFLHFGSLASVSF